MYCNGIGKKGDVKRKQIEKGMTVFSLEMALKNVCMKFKAAIKIFSKSVTIKSGYNSVLHIGAVKQTAVLRIDPDENNNNDVIGFNNVSSDIAIVSFEFTCHSEYIEPYSIIIFKNGEIHGIGVVLNIIPMEN